jgi:hypothetical protein
MEEEFTMSSHLAPQQQDLWQQYFPTFPETQDAAVDAFMSSAKLVNVPSQQMVFSAGDPFENYLLLLEGCIRVQ